jgi:hypothetical protein
MFCLDDATWHLRDAGRLPAARFCLAIMALHDHAKMTPIKMA